MTISWYLLIGDIAILIMPSNTFLNDFVQVSIYLAAKSHQRTDASSPSLQIFYFFSFSPLLFDREHFQYWSGQESGKRWMFAVPQNEHLIKKANRFDVLHFWSVDFLEDIDIKEPDRQKFKSAHGQTTRPKIAAAILKDKIPCLFELRANFLFIRIN